MPNQGPWSECNHCNNNMLAIHKHNASALFGTPSGTTVQGPWSKIQRYGVLCLIPTVELQGHPGHGPRALDLGALVLGP
jgi:hypothetical protein